MLCAGRSFCFALFGNKIVYLFQVIKITMKDKNRQGDTTFLYEDFAQVKKKNGHYVLSIRLFNGEWRELFHYNFKKEAEDSFHKFYNDLKCLSAPKSYWEKDY